MNDEMSGLVETEPRPADDRRITFRLFCEDPGQHVVCMSSLRFEANFPIERGQRVALSGRWVTDLRTGEGLYFLFDAGLQTSAGF